MPTKCDECVADVVWELSIGDVVFRLCDDCCRGVTSYIEDTYPTIGLKSVLRNMDIKHE